MEVKLLQVWKMSNMEILQRFCVGGLLVVARLGSARLGFRWERNSGASALELAILALKSGILAPAQTA